jgi:uncharacterized membrane protein
MKIIYRIYSLKISPLTALGIFSGFNVLWSVGSVIRSGDISYLFLVWNLFLAWVPFFIALIWFKRLEFHSDPLKRWKSIVLGMIWLVFLPNAPYLITDLKHLSGRFDPAHWSDSILFFGMAMNGLVLGVYSLHFVHRALRYFFTGIKAWFLVLGSVVACGFGVYLGRVERWNSCDLITQPYPLFKNAIQSLADPLAIKMTIGFSLLTFIVYLVLKTIITYESDQKKS